MKRFNVECGLEATTLIRSENITTPIIALCSSLTESNELIKLREVCTSTRQNQYAKNNSSIA